MSFNSLGLSDALLSHHQKRYTTPSPIQQKSNSTILEGKDVLASAQTGTGKQPVLHYLFKYYHKVNNCDKDLFVP
jgi:ATP-dependent RNA helicase RhlE